MYTSFSKKRSILEANKRLEMKRINEQAKEEQSVKEVVTDVAKEGIKNVTQQMIDNPPFKGELFGYTITGYFNGVNYVWKCIGVENFPGIRGVSRGVVVSEYNKNLSPMIKKTVDDADPNGVFVGFVSDNGYPKIVVYTTKDKKIKALEF